MLASLTRRSLTAAKTVLYPDDPRAQLLTWATMASATANGVFYSVSALFFTRIVGLTPATVGIGLTIAGAVGVGAAFAAGVLADRLGAQRLLLAATAGQGVALLVYVLASNAVSFTAIACCAVGLRAAQSTARSALLARSFTGRTRILVRARLRVVLNLFVALGTAAAAIALLVDTAAAYVWAILLVGGLTVSSCLPLAALLRRVPEPIPTPFVRRRSRQSPLRDRRYLMLTALNAVMIMHFGLQTVGIPLWVAMHTQAPLVTVSALLALNAVLVTFLQVPATRGTHDVRGAGRAVARAGALLVLACALYAGSAAGGPAVAVVLLLLAATAHTGAEMWSDAGSSSLAFELADERSTGAYQGLSQTGIALGGMLAPAVVTATVIDHGTTGWIILAVTFGGAATLTWLIARAQTKRALENPPTLESAQRRSPKPQAPHDGQGADTVHE